VYTLVLVLDDLRHGLSSPDLCVMPRVNINIGARVFFCSCTYSFGICFIL